MADSEERYVRLVGDADDDDTNPNRDYYLKTQVIPSLNTKL